MCFLDFILRTGTTTTAVSSAVPTAISADTHAAFDAGQLLPRVLAAPLVLLWGEHKAQLAVSINTSSKQHV